IGRFWKLHLTTFLNSALRRTSAAIPAILAAVRIIGARRVSQVQKRASTSRVPRVIALIVLLLLPPPNRARSTTVRVPFRTVQAMILIDGKVNGNPATFLLDTGSNRTIVSTRVYGNVEFDW